MTAKPRHAAVGSHPAPGPAEDRYIDGRTVRITTPDRVLWPHTGTTKRDLVDYLLTVAPVLLPHIRDRGLTLRRFPDGVTGKSWYQAQCRGNPAFVRTHDVPGARGELLRYCIVEDAAGLAWLANLSNLELHPFLSTASRPDEPALFVVDLDPRPPASILAAARAALQVLDVLDGLGIPAWLKVSGGRGIHVLVPLAPGHDFGHTKAAARALADRLARAYPDEISATMARDPRAGRVLVDWLQNDPTRSTAAPYSPRATPVPLVSMPVHRDELREAVRAGRPDRLRFGFSAALARVAGSGDLLAPLLDPRGGVRLPPPEAFA
jgi:bifunctional non-homologous end joining protein LigD